MADATGRNKALEARLLKDYGGAPSDEQFEKRKAGRFVPMKVLVLGLGRTGTSSIRAALMQLGYSHTYHMASVVLENPADSDVWVDAIERKFEGRGPPVTVADFDKVLGHCMAVTDWPGAAFPDELIAAYPDALVILSVRDTAEAWHKSVLESIYRLRSIAVPAESAWKRVLQSAMPLPGKAVMAKLFQHHIITDDFPERGAQAYLEHNAHVRAITPPERLLEFNVKQGWAPLCHFLGVPVPDGAFPRINEGASTREVMGAIVRQGQVALFRRSLPWLVAAAAAVAAVAYAGAGRTWLEQAVGPLQWSGLYAK